MKKGFVFLMALLLSGCSPGWTRIQQPQVVGPAKVFAVEAPAGWMHLPAGGEVVLLSRDGTSIQFIRVSKVPHDKAFPKIGKASTEAALPSELAAHALAELKSYDALAALEVVENAPLQLAGRDGFRLHVRFRDSKGLRFDRVICGVADREGLYMLVFQAPALHFFARDLPAYENVVRSFRFGGA